MAPCFNCCPAPGQLAVCEFIFFDRKRAFRSPGAGLAQELPGGGRVRHGILAGISSTVARRGSCAGAPSGFGGESPFLNFCWPKKKETLTPPPTDPPATLIDPFGW